MEEGQNYLAYLMEKYSNKTIIFLVSRESEKVIPKVKSICYEIKLSKLSIDDIRTKLMEIAKIEKVELKEKEAFRIADISDGNLNKALNIFEKEKLEYLKQDIFPEQYLGWNYLKYSPSLPILAEIEVKEERKEIPIPSLSEISRIVAPAGRALNVLVTRKRDGLAHIKILILRKYFIDLGAYKIIEVVCAEYASRVHLQFQKRRSFKKRYKVKAISFTENDSPQLELAFINSSFIKRGETIYVVFKKGEINTIIV